MTNSTIPSTLLARSENCCELCKSADNLQLFSVAAKDKSEEESGVVVCHHCFQQLTGAVDTDANHWRCLSDAMWNPAPAVQVLSWRMLKKLETEGWAQDLLSMLYLEPDVEAWALEGIASNSDESKPTLDSNGAQLNEGDTVTLIKDLNVKGGGFTAKRGTAVRNIRLTDNPEQIEGKVNGMQIVLLTCYLKKAN